MNDAYGNQLIFGPDGGTPQNPTLGTPLLISAYSQHYTYTGRYCDEETFLYHYRARYYDPALGRFLGRDPIIYGDGYNMYQYVGGGPLDGLDPSGLASSSGAAVVVVVGVVYVVAKIGSSISASSEESEMPDCADCGESTEDNPVFRDKDGNCCITVKLVCRSLQGTTGSLGGKHCYLSISDATGNILGTISAFPQSEFENVDGFGKIYYKPDGDAGTGGSNYPFTMGEKGSCKWLKCAHSYAKMLHMSYDYGGTNNNSNTFVTKIIRKCGGTANFPFGAFGSDDL